MEHPTNRTRTAAGGGGGEASEAAALLRCGVRVLCVWLALSSGPSVWASLRGPDALALSFYSATLVTGWPAARSRRRAEARRVRAVPGFVSRLRRVGAFGLGLLAGLATHPALVVVIGLLGRLPGARMLLPAPVPLLDPIAVPCAARLLVALVVLSPLFEETLYRGMLLPRCRRRFGPGIAVVVSGLAFALPHVRPWPIFGALVAGVILGSIRLRTRDVMLCIAVHAGWNAAACLAPTASSHDPARMGASALLGGLALAGALRLDTADGRVGTVS